MKSFLFIAAAVFVPFVVFAEDDELDCKTAGSLFDHEMRASIVDSHGKHPKGAQLKYSCWLEGYAQDTAKSCGSEVDLPNLPDKTANGKNFGFMSLLAGKGAGGPKEILNALTDEWISQFQDGGESYDWKDQNLIGCGINMDCPGDQPDQKQAFALCFYGTNIAPAA